MPLEDSPSLDVFENGVPDKIPSAPSGRRNAWIAIAILFVLAAGMGAMGFLRSRSAAVLAGQGSVSGRVLDTSGAPLAAEIYVENSNAEAVTDASGAFTISNVPAGQQVIVISYAFTGQEYPLQVHTGQTVVMETVYLETRLREEYPLPRREWR